MPAIFNNHPTEFGIDAQISLQTTAESKTVYTLNFDGGLLVSYSYPVISYVWNGTALRSASKTWKSGNYSYTVSISDGYVTYTQQGYTEREYWTDWAPSSVTTTSGARISSSGSFTSGYDTAKDDYGEWYYGIVSDYYGSDCYLYTKYGSKKIVYMSYDPSMPVSTSPSSVTWYDSDDVQYGFWLNDGAYERHIEIETVPGEEEEVTGEDAYYDTYNQERSYCYVYKLDGTQVSLGYTPNRIYFDLNAVGTGSSYNRHELESDEYATFVFNGTTRYFYNGRVYSTKSVTSNSTTETVAIDSNTPASGRTFYFRCAGADGSTSLSGSPNGRDTYVSNTANSSILFSTDGEVYMIGNDIVSGIVRVKYSGGGMVFANGYLINDNCYTL